MSKIAEVQRAPQLAGYRCPANGCPLAGSISDTTLGGGTWYCRFHFQQPSRLFDAITLQMRGQIARGEPLDDTAETMTVSEMKTRVRRSIGGRVDVVALLAKIV